MNPVIVGAIVLSVLGVAVGAVGTYSSIKNAKGPRERAFMIRSAIILWASVSVALAVILLLPAAGLWICVACVVLLPLGIRYENRKQMAIRREEQTNADQSLKTSEETI